MQDLPNGFALPTERELAIAHGMSRSTVRHTLQQLEAEQRIYRRQGKGTFVARSKIDQALELTSHTEGMRARGISPGSKLIDVSRVAAGGHVASMLSISPQDEVLRIERLRTGDGEPIAIELLHLDATRFDGISTDLGNSISLYHLLYLHYGVTLAWAEETIEAVIAGTREAELLGYWPGAPLLMLSRQTFDTTGNPTEYVRSLYRGDRFRFHAQIRRPEDPVTESLESANHITLRPVRAEDLTGLVRIFIDVWQSSFRGIVSDALIDALSEAEVTDRLRRLATSLHTATIVAESGGRVVGFIRYGDDLEDPRDGHIYSLFVAPSAADQGVGTRLLHNAIDAAGGSRTLTIWVLAADLRTRSLCASSGFSPDGAHRLEPQCGAEEIRMRRSGDPFPHSDAYGLMTHQGSEVQEGKLG